MVFITRLTASVICFFALFLRAKSSYDECGTWKFVDHVNLETDMLVTGGTDIHGHILLVCRAPRSPKILLPGKARPEWGKCWTSYAGGEAFTDKFEVLVEDTPKSFQWIPYKGVIPDNAVLGGREHIAPMYIGRCTLRGKFSDNSSYVTDVAGKIHYKPFDPKFVYVPFAGREWICRENLKILVCTDPELAKNKEKDRDDEEVAMLIDPRVLQKNSTRTKKRN